MADVIEINVTTGEKTERNFTAQEIANTAEATERERPRREIRDAMNTKKSDDIAALGTRAEMRAATASANSVPALRARVALLEEIIYSNEKNTID